MDGQVVMTSFMTPHFKDLPKSLFLLFWVDEGTQVAVTLVSPLLSPQWLLLTWWREVVLSQKEKRSGDS